MPCVYCPWVMCVHNSSNTPHTRGLCQADQIHLGILNVNEFISNNNFDDDIKNDVLSYIGIHSDDVIDVDLAEVMGCQTFEWRKRTGLKEGR